ncbi:hypothetical protein ACOMHN_022200 [Nucella lapillus]
MNAIDFYIFWSFFGAVIPPRFQAMWTLFLLHLVSFLWYQPAPCLQQLYPSFFSPALSHPLHYSSPPPPAPVPSVYPLRHYPPPLPSPPSSNLPMRYSRDQLLEIQPSTPNFELVNRLRELRLGVGLPRKRGCRGGRKKLRSIQVVPSRNLHPLMVPPFLQPHPDLQSAVGNAPLSSKHPTHLPTTDCLLSITPLMGGQPSDAPALSPPSPLQQGGQSSNAPALSPPSPLPQGSQPIALVLSPSSPLPQDGQPSDAPGLSPSSSTLLLCPSDSTLSICHLNSQSAVKTVTGGKYRAWSQYPEFSDIVSVPRGESNGPRPSERQRSVNLLVTLFTSPDPRKGAGKTLSLCLPAQTLGKAGDCKPPCHSVYQPRPSERGGQDLVTLFTSPDPRKGAGKTLSLCLPAQTLGKAGDCKPPCHSVYQPRPSEKGRARPCHSVYQPRPSERQGTVNLLVTLFTSPDPRKGAGKTLSLCLPAQTLGKGRARPCHSVYQPRPSERGGQDLVTLFTSPDPRKGAGKTLSLCLPAQTLGKAGDCKPPCHSVYQPRPCKPPCHSVYQPRPSERQGTVNLLVTLFTSPDPVNLLVTLFTSPDPRKGRGV